MYHVDHPDDERYDEITVKIVERWKESELSGDEWRFSYLTEYKRKGEVIFSFTTGRLDWALQGIQWKMLVAGEDDKVDREAWNRTKDKCDQPGCSEVAVWFYMRKKRYTNQGEELAYSEFYNGNEYRQFCTGHKRRGDCGLDDADANYIPIPDPNKED